MKKVLEVKSKDKTIKVVLRHLKKSDKDGVWKNFNEALDEGIYLPVFTLFHDNLFGHFAKLHSAR